MVQAEVGAADRCPARLPRVRRTEREGGLVRRLADRRPGQSAGVLAGAERRFGARGVCHHEQPIGTEDERRETFALVEAAFAQRRKMLRQALSGIFGSGPAASAALEAAGVDPTQRGEQLDVHDFLRVARSVAAVDR